IGYNIKGGLSYNIDNKHFFFGNAGMYSRQPFHDNIYMNYGNDVNPFTEHEEIVGLELEYKFNSKYISVNVNAYITTWANRVESSSEFADADNTWRLTDNDLIYTVDRGAKQDHRGIEIDVGAPPLYGLAIRGFASAGDWTYERSSIRQLSDETSKLFE